MCSCMYTHVKFLNYVENFKFQLQTPTDIQCSIGSRPSLVYVDNMWACNSAEVENHLDQRLITHNSHKQACKYYVHFTLTLRCVCACVCVCVCVCVGYLGKKRKIVLDCGRRMPTSPRVAA